MSDYSTFGFIISILILIDCDICFGKLSKTNDEHLANLDFIRPDLVNPIPNFKIKNSADVLNGGRKIANYASNQALKKTKKAKDTLLKASYPYSGTDTYNRIVAPKSILGAAPVVKRIETEAERAARVNKQLEKLIQFTALLGHVDSFLYDRTKSVVKTLHRMMGDDREFEDALDFETNELRRRRHSPYHGEQKITNFDQTKPQKKISDFEIKYPEFSKIEDINTPKSNFEHSIPQPKTSDLEIKNPKSSEDENLNSSKSNLANSIPQQNLVVKYPESSEV